MADWLGSPGLWRKRSAAVVRCDLADVKETTGEQSLPEEMRAAIRGDRERAQKKRRYEPATTEAPTGSGAITEAYPAAAQLGRLLRRRSPTGGRDRGGDSPECSSIEPIAWFKSSRAGPTWLRKGSRPR